MAPAAQAAEISFEPPGDLGGSGLLAGATTAILLFDPEQPATVDFETAGGTHVTLTKLDINWLDFDIQPSPTREKTEVGPFQFAAATGPVSSLVVQGDLNIEEFRVEHGFLHPGAPGARCFFDWMGDDENSHPGRRQEICPSEKDGILYAGERATENLTWISLSTTRASVVEWFGLEIECKSGECPSGGGFGQEASLPGTTSAGYVRTREHEQFHPVDGSLRIRGYVKTALVAGTGLDMDLTGWIRLPGTVGTPGCDDCISPMDQTLYADGDIRLHDLRAGDDGSMAASFSGDLAFARFDETTVDPTAFLASSSAATAVVATAAVGLLLKFVGGALFTKLSKEKALAHPRRQLLYQYIQDHPGANFRELVRQSEIASGTARHHLSVLRRGGHIVEKPHGGTVRFFENHGKFEASWGSVVLLREPPLKLLHDWLTANPNVPQKAILEGMEASGWSRSTTQHRLLRLQEGKLVSMRQQGRLKFYSIAPAVTEKRVGLPPLAAPVSAAASATPQS